MLYWGLDYPPLTAYHSWICGAVANTFNPSYVALESSRGYESPEHKTFMRYTVLVADIICYFLPVLLLAAKSTVAGDISLTGYTLLAYPGLILIDHGHFQYNCVSLGLVLASYCALTSNKHLTSAILFCLALNYKQMTLYYALPIFVYFLKKCYSQYPLKGLAGVFSKFLNLSIAVLLTFALIWSPFATDLDGIAQVAHRLFPLDRGVFEDKVSNFWCILNIFYKIKTHFSNRRTALICGIFTLISTIPSCVLLLFKANRKTFLYSLFNCSMGFFLFSFQVHEKTILLVALPAMLLFDREIVHCFWFLSISTFSMLPLLIKDQLVIPYFALTAFFSLSITVIVETKNVDFFEKHKFPKWLPALFKASMTLQVLLSVASLTVAPPPRYPDIFPLLISAFSAVHFAYFFLYFHWAQFISGKVKSS